MEILLKAVVAAIVTLLLERAPRFLEARRMRKKHFALLGSSWNGYHFSSKHKKPLLIQSKWSIQPGWLKPFLVTFKQPGLTYQGHLAFESDDRIIVYLRCVEHEERMIYRFANPLKSTNDIVWGLWLSFDHDRHIASGGAILTQEELSEADAASAVKECVVSCADGDVPLLRVNT